jgi:MFS family permease
VGGANKTMPEEYTRKVWIEIDSQILNALFCVTGLGLIPWRVRDLYQVYREKDRHKVLHRHSYTDNLTWIRVIIWTFVANSLFQIGMAVCMWSMDMYTRPAWLVGLFVGLGCCSGMFAGLAQFFLGRQTKKRTSAEQGSTNVLKV